MGHYDQSRRYSTYLAEFAVDMREVIRKCGRWEFLLIAISIMIAIAFAVWMAIVASDRKLTPLEAVLFQFVVLVVGLGGSLIGSYKFGQNMPANKQYARSALRSVLVMFRSLRRSMMQLRDSKRNILRTLGWNPYNYTLKTKWILHHL